MSYHVGGILPTPPEGIRPEKALAAEIARGLLAAQVAVEDELISFGDEAAFNPVRMINRFRTLEERLRPRDASVTEEEKLEEVEGAIQDVEETSDFAQQYNRRNPELKTRSLLLLRSRLNQQDSAETVLRETMAFYPDFTLADEVLDFLADTTEGDLADSVAGAKRMLEDDHSREIRAGKNIQEQARAFSAEGLGDPTALRNLYREITGNPRDALTLFQELALQFPYAKMKSVLNFIFHSLGADLRAKGPSIARGELHQLITQTRNMQAILGVFRFFLSRMNLITSAFARQGLVVPPTVKFEILGKFFVTYLTERYPSVERVLNLGKLLGIAENELAQIVLYTQFRDAVRGVAPRLFQSRQHQQDVLVSFMEAIEELEDRLEDKEEQKEQKKPKRQPSKEKQDGPL